MSKERLIISQLVNKATSLDEDARKKLLDDAVDQGVIDEVGAGTLMQALRVIETKKVFNKQSETN